MSAMTPMRSTVWMDRASRNGSTVAPRTPATTRKSAAFGSENRSATRIPEDGEEDASGDDEDDEAEVGDLGHERSLGIYGAGRTEAGLTVSLHGFDAGLTPNPDTGLGVMRKPILFACSIVAAAVLGASAGAAPRDVGVLSVEDGKRHGHARPEGLRSRASVDRHAAGDRPNAVGSLFGARRRAEAHSGAARAEDRHLPRPGASVPDGRRRLPDRRPRSGHLGVGGRQRGRLARCRPASAR